MDLIAATRAEGGLVFFVVVILVSLIIVINYILVKIGSVIAERYFVLFLFCYVFAVVVVVADNDDVFVFVFPNTFHQIFSKSGQ